MAAWTFGGLEARLSTSPIMMAHSGHHNARSHHHHHDHQDNDLASKTRFTDFFIETILGPDFGGSTTTTTTTRRPGKVLNHHSHHHHNHHHHHHRHSPISRKEEDRDDARRREEKVSGVASKLPAETRPLTDSDNDQQKNGDGAGNQWPAWVYCTRYSDRPSSGKRRPRVRKITRREKKDEKRPRTAFSASQLQRLKQEFQSSNYLTEQRRRTLAKELTLSESQIKIWFQNKRAKIKKASGMKNELALQLMAQGLYNHSTVPLDGQDGLENSKPFKNSGDCSRSDYTSDSDIESVTH